MNALFDTQDFGTELARIRKEQGLSQTDLAQQAGVSRALISDLETRQMHDPGIKKVFRILRVLGKGIRIAPFAPPTLDDLLEDLETSYAQRED